MRGKQILHIAAAVCTVAVASVADAQPKLLINQISPYLGYGYGLSYWDDMTSALNSAFGASNITVSNSPLTDLAQLLTFDRAWVTIRPFGELRLSALEIANLQAFVATGRRVALIGDNATFSAWNKSILAVVGGSYLGKEGHGFQTAFVSHPLTAGLTGIFVTEDGVAVGGTSLFDSNVATLWSGNGSDNVFSLLSANAIDDIYGASPGNMQFKTNIATWLAGPAITAAPEPATVYLVGIGVIALCGAARGRRRRREVTAHDTRREPSRRRSRT
jgi:hypothetical protein